MKGIKKLKEMMIGKSEYVLRAFWGRKINFGECYGALTTPKTKVISRSSKQGQHTTTFLNE
jgi:hypothetical protein